MRASLFLLVLVLSGCPDTGSERKPVTPPPAAGAPPVTPPSAAGDPPVAPAPAAAPPVRGSAQDPRVLAALQTLEAHVRRRALADPDDTWALVHGVIALGPKARLPDGRLAVDVALAHAGVQEIGGRKVPVFTGRSAAGTPREPHRNGTLASLLEAGVSLDHPFRAGGHAFRVSHLREAALWTFEVPADEDWGREAWTLAAAARGVGSGSEARFVNARGEEHALRELARRAVDRLEARTDFLATAKAAGRAVAKRRQEIWAEPCGGFHLVGAGAAWLADDVLGPEVTPRLERQAELLIHRLELEERIYRRTRRSARGGAALLVSVQELKFYGHWLQTTAALRDGGVPIDPAAVTAARDALVETVRRLERLGAFENVDAIAAERRQTYLDLIGDAAHAVAGLRAWE